MKRHSWFSFAFAFCLVLSLVGMDWNNVGDSFREGKMRYAVLTALGLACWRLRRANPFLSAFCFLNGFMWVFNDYNSYGVLDTLMPLTMFFLAVRITDEFTVEGFAKIVAWCAFAQAVYGIAQVLHVDPFLDVAAKAPDLTDFRGKAIGTMGHFTMLAPFVGLGLCYFLSKKKWFPAAVCALCIFLCDSTMGVLSSAAGVWYLAFRYSPKRSLIAGALGVVTLLVAWLAFPGHSFFALSGRAFVWEYGWYAFTLSPYIGHGPGSWLGLYPVWNVPGSMVWAQVHNEYLQLVVELGVLGLFIAGVTIANGLVKAAASAPFLGAWLILLCVNSLANFPMHVATFGLVAAWLLVVLERGDVAPVRIAR